MHTDSQDWFDLSGELSLSFSVFKGYHIHPGSASGERCPVWTSALKMPLLPDCLRQGPQATWTAGGRRAWSRVINGPPFFRGAERETTQQTEMTIASHEETVTAFVLTGSSFLPFEKTTAAQSDAANIAIRGSIFSFFACFDIFITSGSLRY